MIRTLRPNMLTARDNRSRSWSSDARGPFAIKVYIDGIPTGGIASLSMLDASSVWRVRWLSGLDATTRYGINHGDGVIEVTTLARPR